MRSALLVASLLVALPWRAGAQMPLTEYGCLRGTAKAVGKYARAEGRCLVRCEAGARRGHNPATDCMPPYAGTMHACMAQPGTGAAAKLVAGIDRACAAECPTCFGDCSVWKSWVLGYALGYLQNFDPQYHFCDDAGSADGLSRAEAACLDTQWSQSTRLIARTLGCYRRCLTDVAAGRRPPTSCFSPGDAVASGCVADPARDPDVATAAAIDRACTDAPECTPAPATGAQWAFGAESTAELLVFFMHCGSPNPAFLD